jgi:formylglycine-generating enzyme required for sulfatase activity
MIVSIREEYLGHLYEFERAVPELLRKKLRVEPMHLEKVQSVLQGVGTLPQSNVRLEEGQAPEIAKTIFEKIRGEEKTLGIQLPYLQVFLDKYYLQCTDDETRQAEALFTLEKLRQMGDLGDVLRNFLDEQVLETAKTLEEKPATIWQMLSPFVTLEGTKEPLSAAELRQRLPENTTGTLLTRVLESFVSRRILRFSENEQRYEIAHDSLAKQLHARRTDDEIALLEVQRLIRSQVAIKAEAREYFTGKQLDFIEPFLPQLRLTDEEKNWLKSSKQYRQEQEAAEEQRQKEELAAARAQAEKEKELREKAQEKEKQARQRTRLAMLISLIAIVMAIFAGNTLLNLQRSNQDVVRLILQNAEKDIYQLKYEEALDKIKAAASLGASKPEVAAAYLEIAFWYGERKETQRAQNILDSAALLVPLNTTLARSGDAFSHREWIKAYDTDLYQKLMERYYPVMVAVEGGVFEMGCDPTIDPDCSADETLHQQEVSSFKMAKYETTWWQYDLFCQATGHEYESPGWGRDGDNPAVYISWFDAILYSNWVNKQLGLDTFYVFFSKNGNYYDVSLNQEAQRGYRLPTEAEWEYAARGGNQPDGTIYSGSNDLDSVGWYYKNSGSRTQAVGDTTKQSNSMGIYDMSGNVREWCWDWYGGYPDSAFKDYKGPETSSNRVLRGGSWNDYAHRCRSAYRYYNYPDYRNIYYGFRLVFVP